MSPLVPGVPFAPIDTAGFPAPPAGGSGNNQLSAERSLTWRRALEHAQQSDLAALYSPFTAEFGMPGATSAIADESALHQSALTMTLNLNRRDQASQPETAPKPDDTQQSARPPANAQSAGSSEPSRPNDTQQSARPPANAQSAGSSEPSRDNGYEAAAMIAPSSPSATAKTPPTVSPDVAAVSRATGSWPSAAAGQPTGLDSATLSASLAAILPLAAVPVANPAEINAPAATSFTALNGSTVQMAPALSAGAAPAESSPIPDPSDGEGTLVEERPSNGGQYASEPAAGEPMRVYAEWSDQGVRVWLGSDADQSLPVPALMQQMQQWLAGQGEKLLTLVWNGRPMPLAVDARPARMPNGALGAPDGIGRNNAHSLPEIPDNH
jgi:hypothetical protein